MGGEIIRRRYVDAVLGLGSSVLVQYREGLTPADRAGADGALEALFFEPSAIDWLDQAASLTWEIAALAAALALWKDCGWRVSVPLAAAGWVLGNVLMDVDTQTREILVWRNDRPVVVGFDGRSRPVPFEPAEIRAQSSTYLRLGQGWVAWDAYREDGPYQVGWSLPGGSGRHRANTGRSVTSAAVDPAGRLIAISETTTLCIGHARDVVYVLRTDTGADVFRTYLPRYTRSQVVFFEGGLFGYSNLEGTRILKVTEAR